MKNITIISKKDYTIRRIIFGVYCILPIIELFFHFEDIISMIISIAISIAIGLFVYQGLFEDIKYYPKEDILELSDQEFKDFIKDLKSKNYIFNYDEPKTKKDWK